MQIPIAIAGPAFTLPLAKTNAINNKKRSPKSIMSPPTLETTMFPNTSTIELESVIIYDPPLTIPATLNKITNIENICITARIGIRIALNNPLAGIQSGRIAFNKFTQPVKKFHKAPYIFVVKEPTCKKAHGAIAKSVAETVEQSVPKKLAFKSPTLLSLKLVSSVIPAMPKPLSTKVSVLANQNTPAFIAKKVIRIQIAMLVNSSIYVRLSLNMNANPIKTTTAVSSTGTQLK